MTFIAHHTEQIVQLHILLAVCIHIRIDKTILVAYYVHNRYIVMCSAETLKFFTTTSRIRHVNHIAGPWRLELDIVFKQFQFYWFYFYTLS